jgi:hypothetical protein
MEEPLLTFVLSELEARKGQWATIAREMEPDAWESYYSWLNKVAQGRIPDPSVNKIQRLADHLRGIKRDPPEQKSEQAAV